MSIFAASGLAIDLPPGWDGQIRSTQPGTGDGSSTRIASTDPPACALLHAASFALPADRGDYGSGAVELMGGSDVLICLLEHEPAAAQTALFRREGVPRLRPGDFSPTAMQRTMPGMAGSQHFFQADGRPFCLYVVLGSALVIAPLVKLADRVVRSISVGSSPTGGGYDAVAHGHP